ncbi:MAG: hypothetical protein AAF327_02395 [Cyanobacteria bacterium P01_A01_bin.37]
MHRELTSQPPSAIPFRHDYPTYLLPMVRPPFFVLLTPIAVVGSLPVTSPLIPAAIALRPV